MTLLKVFVIKLMKLLLHQRQKKLIQQKKISARNFETIDYDCENFEIVMMKNELIFYTVYLKQTKKIIEMNNIPQADIFLLINLICQITTRGIRENLRIRIQNKQLIQVKENKLRLFKFVDVAHQKFTIKEGISLNMQEDATIVVKFVSTNSCEGQPECGRLHDNHQDQLMKQEDTPQQFIAQRNEWLEVKSNEYAKTQNVVLNEQIKQNLMTNEEIAKSIENITLGTVRIKVGTIRCKKIIQREKMKPLTEEEMNVIFNCVRKWLNFKNQQNCKKIIEQNKYVR